MSPDTFIVITSSDTAHPLSVIGEGVKPPAPMYAAPVPRPPAGDQHSFRRSALSGLLPGSLVPGYFPLFVYRDA